ncbi:MAG: LVIVD repeat-containing protein [Candidatus Hodarchaeales archaeon]
MTWQDRVTAYNISTPSDPVYISEFATDGEVNQIAIYGSYAMIGKWHTSLTVYNISDINNPVKIGTNQYLQDGHYQRILIRNDTIYAACYNKGLVILDCKDPSSVKYICSLGYAGIYGDVEANGEILYAVNGKTIEIFNFSDPWSPQLISKTNFFNDECWYSHEGNKNIRYDNNNNILYVATWNKFGAIDVANPSFPNLLDVIDVSFGHTLFIDSSCNLAIISQGAMGLTIVDISDPSSLTVLSTIDADGWSNIIETVLYDSTLYVIDKYEGMRYYDISTPQIPILIGFTSWSAFNLNSIVSVTLNSSYLYVTACVYDNNYPSTILVLSLADPYSPQIVNTDYETDYNWWSIKIFVKGKLGVTIHWSCGSPKLIDLGNLSHFTIIAEYPHLYDKDNTYEFTHLSVGGNMIYTSTHGFSIVSFMMNSTVLSAPTVPVFLTNSQVITNRTFTISWTKSSCLLSSNSLYYELQLPHFCLLMFPMETISSEYEL